MKRKVLISSLEGKEFFMDCNYSSETVKFTPLEERLKVENPELMDGMSKLKAKMEDNDFQKYINSLISIKKYKDEMFMITQSAINKTIIEFKFLKPIFKSFGLSKIRVFSQPY